MFSLIVPIMNLAITSDLHLPITPSSAIRALAYEVAAFGPDAFVVAGDVAESLADLERCLGILKREVSCPILVLAGNHDLWARDAGSRRKWEELISETVRKAGCVWLEKTTFVKDGVGVAGSIGWYDYSAADPSVKLPPEVFAREKRHYNPDGYLL